jgi:hypothetical protein
MAEKIAKMQFREGGKAPQMKAGDGACAECTEKNIL